MVFNLSYIHTSWGVKRNMNEKKNYRIITMLKSGIKDNAGDAVTNALRNMSFDIVKNVRIGKVYYIKCEADTKIKPIANALVNVVMEDYLIFEEL